MNIGIFCSANNQIDAAYFRAAEELGRWMAENGHTLVYGGCNLGLMEAVGRAAHDHGGTTVGVVPRIVEKAGRVSDAVSVDIGYHRKKLYLLNIGGFYDALTAALDDLARRGMVRGDWHDCIEPVSTLSELQEKLA